MSDHLPVRGKILSSSPCSIKAAAALLGAFLQSDTVPETGLLRGYLERVSGALEELASKPPPKKKSQKHRELDHKIADNVQKDDTRADLGGEAVKSEAEQWNGFKGGPEKKRKAERDDAEGEERVVKKRKSHS
jgi:hypothetical protein